MLTSGYFSRKTSELCKHFHRYFMHNLMMAKTAFRLDGQSQRARNGSGGELVLRTWGKGVGRHPDCHQDSWTSSETLSPNLSFDNMNCIDPYAGCSDILLLIINDVTDLRRELTSTAIPGLPISLESLMEENIQWFHTLYLRLKATLENLPQILPSLTEEGNIENERRRRALEGILLATSEAHRYAALVLLEETVSLASKCSSSISGPWNDGDGPFSGYDPQDRDLYVVRTIELVQTVVNLTETGLTAVWPLWPLFIAGCITDDRRYRRLVLELFEGVLSRTPFRHIIYAKRVIEMVWVRRDTGMSDQLSDSSSVRDGDDASSVQSVPSHLSYEREKIMSETGWMMSLA